MKFVLRGFQQPQQALREGEQRQDVAKRRDQQQQAGLEIPDQRDHCLANIVAFSHCRPPDSEWPVRPARREPVAGRT